MEGVGLVAPLVPGMEGNNYLHVPRVRNVSLSPPHTFTPILGWVQSALMGQGEGRKGGMYPFQFYNMEHNLCAHFTFYITCAH